ncbi:hypothetical protein CRENBAI_014237 [Crenichthys baileyi]|uniref:Uncharacterized protein n=1 Tax=Crenichthys baileyi TaxID=28760 RepID=A0AAV9SPE5_9TELE
MESDQSDTGSFAMDQSFEVEDFSPLSSLEVTTCGEIRTGASLSFPEGLASIPSPCLASPTSLPGPQPHPSDDSVPSSGSRRKIFMKGLTNAPASVSARGSSAASATVPDLSGGSADAPAPVSAGGQPDISVPALSIPVQPPVTTAQPLLHAHLLGFLWGILSEIFSAPVSVGQSSSAAQPLPPLSPPASAASEGSADAPASVYAGGQPDAAVPVFAGEIFSVSAPCSIEGRHGALAPGSTEVPDQPPPSSSPASASVSTEGSAGALAPASAESRPDVSAPAPASAVGRPDVSAPASAVGRLDASAPAGSVIIILICTPGSGIIILVIYTPGSGIIILVIYTPGSGIIILVIYIPGSDIIFIIYTSGSDIIINITFNLR